MPEPILFGLLAVGLLGGSLVHALVDWRSSLPFVGDSDNGGDDVGDDDHETDDDDHDADDRDDPDEDDEDRN
ncbi:hypothetical protein [Halococcus agarilyticus]|uniref:hypothetical protein n=1 Tax=Halococcus agarilyticus TaxID=1232219 RepID=UPI000ADCDC63|nr:hypothetical protein [Halococcus agarilyticus]